MSRRAILGGMSNDAAASRGMQYTPRDLPPLPCGSLNSSGSALKRFDLPEPFRDIGLVLFGSLTTVSAVCVFAILLFIKM